MTTKIILLASLLLIGFMGKSQIDDPFSAPLQQLHKGKNLMEANQINTYLFDSLYFYRSDFENFQTAAEYRSMYYKNSSDTLERMNVYTNANLLKNDPYFLSHYATYEHYKSTTDNHHFIKEIYYDVDGNNNELYSTKTIFEYDELGNLLSSTKQIYSLLSLEWEDNTKYLYFYTDEHIIDKIETYWGTSNKSWVYLFYDQYHYNNAGNIDYIEQIQERNGKETVLKKRIYNYNADHLILSIEDEVNNTVQYRVDFTHDGDGNIISRETSSGFKYEYEYDKNIAIADVGGPFQTYFEAYMIDFIKHPITKYSSYEYINGWTPSTKMTLTYKEVTVDIEPISNEHLFIYPNPITRQQLYINLKNHEGTAQVTIFDHQGRMVLQQNINSNTPINVASLKGGAYVVKTKTGNDTYTNKLIINH